MEKDALTAQIKSKAGQPSSMVLQPNNAPILHSTYYGNSSDYASSRGNQVPAQTQLTSMSSKVTLIVNPPRLRKDLKPLSAKPNSHEMGYIQNAKRMLIPSTTAGEETKESIINGEPK